MGSTRRWAGFYAKTWRDWVFRRHDDRGIPAPRPTPSLAAQAALDEVVLMVFKSGHRPRPPAAVERILAEADAAAEIYDTQGWLGDPLGFFVRPSPPARPQLTRHRAGGLDYERLSFESDYEPHPGEPGRDRWLEHRANRTAYAWIVRHEEPRPWLVCVHGAGMGNPVMDFRGFRAAWLHHELGLNLAVPVLPLHGPRRDGFPLGVGFPTDDVLDTIHAVAQAVWDARRLVGWIRAQSHDVVGVKGLSLGGYTAAVLASVEDDLACVIAGIPAVDFADLITHHAPNRFVRRPDYRALSTMDRRVYRVISPLALTPRVPRERRFIYAGLADRLVPARQQVQELWAHWGQPRISWYEGSHIGFLWSAQVRAFVGEALATAGLTSADYAASA